MRAALIRAVTTAVLILIGPSVTASDTDTTFDLVINNARVIDPESGLDDTRTVGIRGGTVAALSTAPLEGSNVIDASGLVLAPGFIDIHSHTPTLLGQHLGLLDGITTQLDLEMGAWPVTAYGEHFVGGAQFHYGASVSHAAVRSKVMDGLDQPYMFRGRNMAAPGPRTWIEPAAPEQVAAMKNLLEQGLESGGLGIGVLLDYMTKAVTPEELRMIFETAARYDSPVFVHVRRGMPGDPAGLDEILALATETGAPTLICHITHSAMGGIGAWLAKIDAANRAGATVTTETLSWGAGGTSISADVFRRRDWRRIFDIDYTDVQWVATGEWLTEESFKRYQRDRPHGMVNHHYVREAWLEEALRWPGMMVSTDALPALNLDVKTNPNVAGTFSRLLGHYVRDRGVLSLPEAIRRITLLPAQWLEQASPVFAKKGRVQIGADADLVLFDPETIASSAAYGNPYQPSRGIAHVIVGGQIVVQNGQRIEGRYPGQRLINPE